LGLPILVAGTKSDDAFEGCLLLSPDTVLIANTERHSYRTIAAYIPKILECFKEVVYVDVPKARRYMHPDTIYGRVSSQLSLAFLPVFCRTLVYTKADVGEVDFATYMARKGIEIIPVSDSEQRRLACSFVPLEPGVILHYDVSLGRQTVRKLARKGVEIQFFHPEAMLAGGGSLRCLTLQLHRTRPM